MSKKSESEIAIFGFFLVGVVAFFCAPAIAAAIGASGALGASAGGSGALILTLRGAALTSASLASIGGSVLGGKIVISATAGATTALVTSYCQHVERGEVEAARADLMKMKERHESEFLAIKNKYYPHMSPEEKALWDHV